MAVDFERENGKMGGTTALPVVPPAIRSEWQKAAFSQPDIKADDADLNDISAIINGNKAITGKAVYSTNLAGRNADQTETQKADQKKRDAEIQEARELMNLAEWGGQMTNVGGVEMTNEQAQNARQRFIDNEDYYANKAAQHGYIESDEKDNLKRGMRQKKDLEDKKGRGIITDDEQNRLNAWDRSKLGKAGDRVTADIHQGMGVAKHSDIKSPESDAAIKPEYGKSVLDNSDIFKSAPKLKAEFEAANAGITAPEKQPDLPAPKIVSNEVSATGLNI